MHPHIILTNFRPVELQPPVPQARIAETLLRLLATARCVDERPATQEAANAILAAVRDQLEHYGIPPTTIRQRNMNVIPWDELGPPGTPLPGIFATLLQDPRGAGLATRMDLFERVADAFLERAYPPGSMPPDDIVDVSCSGYALPSAAQKLVSRRGWHSTAVTHSYHMGCYGAFPAVRIAHGCLASSWVTRPDPKTRVDLIHTEFLSLHVDPLARSAASLIIMTLFSDGFITYSACAVPPGTQLASPGLRVLTFADAIVPESLDQMSCRLSDHLFEMTLERDVAKLIARHITPFVRRLLAQANVDFDAVRERLHYAIHAGGPKILTFTQEALQLSDRQIAPCWRVLQEHGNMASATVPYIWRDLCASAELRPGDLVVSLAFGPGLTVCGMVLERT